MGKASPTPRSCPSNGDCSIVTPLTLLTSKMSKKKNSSSDELEMDKMAEAELTRLQRQYRIMEGDREAYSDEMRILLKKQRKAIERLEKEKAELITTLECWKCRSHEIKDEKKTSHLKKLLAQHGALEQQIKYERSQLDELEFQIKKVTKEVEGIKKKFKIKDTKFEEIQEEQRAQHQLENRLDVATVKFNRMLANNNKLREEIDHLLKERTSFNHIYQELINRRNNDKKIMLDLMEQSTLAYDQREEAQAKLEALKLKGKQDLLVHSQEMRELQRKLDHDSKLHEFLGLKGQKRVMADLEAKEALKKQQQKEEVENQIHKLQSILEQIKELTGEGDIDRLSAQFLKQEEENYALFNYVNELNNELECLQEQVEELKKNIEEQKEVNKMRALQKQATLQMLETELEIKKKEAEESNKKRENYRNIIDKLLRGVYDIFKLLKCEENPIIELFGETADVTSFNVLLYLGIIERRANKLVRVVKEWEKVEKETESDRIEPKVFLAPQRSRSSPRT